MGWEEEEPWMQLPVMIEKKKTKQNSSMLFKTNFYFVQLKLCEVSLSNREKKIVSNLQVVVEETAFGPRGC